MSRIIDSHIHLSYIDSFFQTAEQQSFVDYSSSGLQMEMKHNGVQAAVAMGVREIEGGEGFPDSSVSSPMGIDLSSGTESGIYYCAGINPYRLNKQDLIRLEKELLKPEVVGIKIYLGYYPFYSADPVYDPVYELARSYDLPVVFHTGDTFSERGILKYAHPLTIDETAVKHRGTRFVLAHFGDPWMLDAAEVVYKNGNVYADLSGLIVGDAREVARLNKKAHFFDHFAHALSFCDRYDKLMFGTDWPLVPMKPYIDFIQSHLPSEAQDDVFYRTALSVFSKIPLAGK
ncbi:amidohydrolase family protein [Salisediminibacterium halotolerans]|uniref:Amidohydrolase-related domain-containing protein n=1 Tax=Salisediminibacterium halotolerans TaxID=517425 RepID=A0A1H9RV17_9BACI|nr:TatD family hydrolase [Salisediminibacterium haloalkalitolerans]SER76700.1 hypothetical protein SAMN05444126_105114 [Salisediminibacterium haloalkalitolerans]